MTLIRCVAVCCSVLQCGTVCCSVLQCIAVCCSVLQCVAVFWQGNQKAREMLKCIGDTYIYECCDNTHLSTFSRHSTMQFVWGGGNSASLHTTSFDALLHITLKLFVSFAEYRFCYRALLQKRPTFLGSLLRV